MVALRKESVDRNNRLFARWTLALKSLSARRAWIEITDNKISVKVKVRSLSARRAWIEMACARGCRWHSLVALRKESVDRNVAPKP